MQNFYQHSIFSVD